MTDDVTKDSNGNILADGDSVTLIKDLKVKGSGGVTLNTVDLLTYAGSDITADLWQWFSSRSGDGANFGTNVLDAVYNGTGPNAVSGNTLPAIRSASAKIVISPATREEVYAMYYDGLRRRIEERGTRDFPELNGRKLYGELTMDVTVDATGRVVEAEIVRPSKSRRLDQQALAIVMAAAPFGPFTAKMRAQADQLVITSRFRFTREDGLETTMQGPSR
jgi:TonB family protein